jgi:hypothetical protein
MTLVERSAFLRGRGKAGDQAWERHYQENTGPNAVMANLAIDLPSMFPSCRDAGRSSIPSGARRRLLDGKGVLNGPKGCRSS